MKTKKFICIGIAIVFFLVMLFSCIALFTVREVQINFAVSDERETTSVQDKLDRFTGKNILFLKENELAESFADNHYLEVVAIKKDYPNVIKIDIKERVEVYEIVSGETVYVTTENGLVLRNYSLSEQAPSREKIRLELDGITVSSATLGNIIATDADDLLMKVFEMAKSVQLANCIKSVILEKAPAFNGVATFNTYTGVKIVVRELFDECVEKIQTAFSKYENASDYEKTFKKIEVFRGQTGEIEAWWTNEDTSI